MEWNLTEEFENISQKLLAENFINESRYALSFANDKIKFSKWGKLKVMYNLRMKGIDDSQIEAAVKEYPQNDYMDMIKKELAKKVKLLKENDKYKRLQKVTAFAAQRGYEHDLARNFFEEIEN